jgi:hypothetical protein
VLPLVFGLPARVGGWTPPVPAFWGAGLEPTLQCLLVDMTGDDVKAAALARVVETGAALRALRERVDAAMEVHKAAIRAADRAGVERSLIIERSEVARQTAYDQFPVRPAVAALNIGCKAFTEVRG